MGVILTELNSLACHSVNVRGFVEGVAVTAEIHCSRIVKQNENDIGLLVIACGDIMMLRA